MRIEIPEGLEPLQVRHAARCFIPRTQTVRLEVPIGSGAMPNFDEMHGITGQAVEMEAMTHMKRLVARKQAD